MNTDFSNVPGTRLHGAYLYLIYSSQLCKVVLSLSPPYREETKARKGEVHFASIHMPLLTLTAQSPKFFFASLVSYFLIFLSMANANKSKGPVWKLGSQR